MVQIGVRVEEDLKKNAEALFDEMGLSMAGAITIFLKTVCREKKIPFEIKADNQPSVDKGSKSTKSMSFEELKEMLVNDLSSRNVPTEIIDLSLKGADEYIAFLKEKGIQAYEL